jgi:hypothetical protein
MKYYGQSGNQSARCHWDAKDGTLDMGCAKHI